VGVAHLQENSMSQIHEAKLAAMRAISKVGIAKLRKNKDQGYNFRGIEDAMNEMSPILIAAGITVTPCYSDLTVSAGESKSGTKLRFATVKGSFTFKAADGSSEVTECYGEGMDSSDKAVSKAQSVAYRTALFETFVVPLMAMNPEEDSGSVGAPDEALAAAEQGMLMYQEYWKKLSPEKKKALEPHHSELKAIAIEADKAGATA
jgi:hypothetical protein